MHFRLTPTELTQTKTYFTHLGRAQGLGIAPKTAVIEQRTQIGRPIPLAKRRTPPCRVSAATPRLIAPAEEVLGEPTPAAWDAATGGWGQGRRGGGQRRAWRCRVTTSHELVRLFGGLQCMRNGGMDLAFRRTDRPRMQPRLSGTASRPPPPPSVSRPLRTRLATSVMPHRLFPVAGRGLTRRGREEWVARREGS
jgi:hypothetical protein